jgi:tetratricopeptide (TPR) repeat protein
MASSKAKPGRLRLFCAHWHAGAKRWRQSADCYHMLLFGPAKKSADYYDRLIHASTVPPVGAQALVSPPWSLVYLEFAPLLIELDDMTGYQRLRHSAIERYANSVVPNFCEIMLQVAVLAPPEEDQKTAISNWGKHAATMQHPSASIAIALLHYRQGDDALALDWCRKCISFNPYPAIVARVHLVQAMAYWRLNKRDIAEQELALGRNMIEEKFRGEFGVGHYAGNLWADWLTDRVLLREADATLNSRATSDNQTDGTPAVPGEKLAAINPSQLSSARIDVGHNLRHLAYSMPWKVEYSTTREAAFRAATKLFQSVTADQPQHWDAWHYLADTHCRLGQTLELLSDDSKAESHFRQAVALFDQHAAAFDSHKVNEKERAEAYFALSGLLSRTERSGEALPHFRRGCVIMEAYLSPDYADRGALNALAWQLASSVDPLRDPERAIELAQKAIAIEPPDGADWNTLGVAQYHAGQWQSAISTLEESMKRRSGGDALDWFFLGMAHWQLGNKDEGRRWYEKSVEWMDANAPANTELIRFRAEADALMGLAEASDAPDAANDEPATKQP